MRLIVDSNRIIAALIKESGVRYILLSPEFELKSHLKIGGNYHG